MSSLRLNTCAGCFSRMSQWSNQLGVCTQRLLITSCLIDLIYISSWKLLWRFALLCTTPVIRRKMRIRGENLLVKLMRAERTESLIGEDCKLRRIWLSVGWWRSLHSFTSCVLVALVCSLLPSLPPPKRLRTFFVVSLKVIRLANFDMTCERNFKGKRTSGKIIV